MIDRTAFYDSVRGSLFRGSLSKAQVQGLEKLLDVWFGHYHDHLDSRASISMLAYLLGTAYHETARTMQPVRETLANTDSQAIDRLDIAWAKGRLGQVKTPYWRNGYFGRGYVQLTHRSNYEKAGSKLKIDLVNNPSLALDPEYAAHILFRGSLEGWFTGAKLSDYITPTTTSFVSARAIINGRDRAMKIAEYADDFNVALRGAYTGVPKVPKTEPRVSWVATLINAIMRIFK